MMTFIRYWNWAKNNGMVIGKITDSNGEIDNLIDFVSADNNVQVHSLINKPITDFHISIELNNPYISYDKPISTSKDKNSDLLILSGVNSIEKNYNYFLGFIGDQNNFSNDASLFDIPIKVKGRENQNVEIYFEYSLNGARYFGKRLITVVPVPEDFSLKQNFPNPFNPTTTIYYDIPIDTYVELTVYDIVGRQVATLIDSFELKGFKSFEWNGKDTNGNKLGSGLYFYQLKSENIIKTKKMIMIK